MKLKLLFLLLFTACIASSQNSVIDRSYTKVGRITLTGDGIFSDSSYGAGNIYRHGDTLIVELSSKQKVLLTGAGNWQVLGKDSVTGIWKPITQSGSGGGGGPVALSSVTNPVGNTAFTMGSNQVAFTWSGGGASTPKMKLTDNDASGTFPTFEILSNNAPASSTIFKATRGGNGIVLTWDGTNANLSVAGPNSAINATKMRGNYPLIKADLPVTTVYTDKVDTFTVNQLIQANSTGALLDVWNQNNGSSSKAYSATVTAGDGYYGIATSGNAIHGIASSGRGMWGHNTANGTGGYFSSVFTGAALVADVNGTQMFVVNYNGGAWNADEQFNSGYKIMLKNSSNVSNVGLVNSNVGGSLDITNNPQGTNTLMARVALDGLHVDGVTSISGLGVNYSDHVLPATSNIDLGSASKPFRRLYIQDFSTSTNWHTDTVLIRSGFKRTAKYISGLIAGTPILGSFSDPRPAQVLIAEPKYYAVTDSVIVDAYQFFDLDYAKFSIGYIK